MNKIAALNEGIIKFGAGGCIASFPNIAFNKNQTTGVMNKTTTLTMKSASSILKAVAATALFCVIAIGARAQVVYNEG